MRVIRSNNSFIRGRNSHKVKYSGRCQVLAPLSTRVMSLAVLVPASASFAVHHFPASADSVVAQGPTTILSISKDSTNRPLLYRIIDFAYWLERWIADVIDLLLRSGFLFFNFSPAVLSLPLLVLGEKGSSTWWNIFRDSIRRSGPCTTKFAQWLATRPDLFPLFICENLQVRWIL